MPTVAPPPLPRLPDALPLAGISTAARQSLRQLLNDDARTLEAAFDAGAQAAALAARRAALVDCVVVHVATACIGAALGGEADGVALYAVGGYGRGQLFPHSDIDLLALLRGEPDAALARGLERFFACLWDIGLKPGQAVREVRECARLAAEDVAVATSLLDARRLAGDAAMDADLGAIAGDVAAWPPAKYLAAKRAEQAARHARHDDTAHNLEPNLKEGPGGLRTLDLLGWLGRRIVGARDLRGLVADGLLDPAEERALTDARHVLERYRYALHLTAGRAEERLLFDYQRDIAERLGFHDRPRDLASAANEPVLGVEQFMQGYYRAATLVERLGVQLVERFDELLEPATTVEPIDAEFQRNGNRLETRDAELFLHRPAALVEAFALRLDHPELIGFTAETMRRIQHALAAAGGRLAEDPAVLAALLALLRRGAPAAEALWRMNRHGLLGAILPPFAQVVGRMQYDLFHVYTVDEHTLRVLRNLAHFSSVGARTEFPLACAVFATLDKPELLLLAGLFHDIAKGRGGDHSVLGEEDARVFCRRLGLPDAEAELVAWLVRWHLLMSVTAQRQDITDPAVVQRFAQQVGDWERLDHLYLLTIADIRGTSPKLWNAWKDRLLADLYVATRYALRSDEAMPLRADVRARACRDRALELLRLDGLEADVATRLWRHFPEASFLRHRPEQIAWQTRALAEHPELPLVAVHPRSIRGTTELFVCAPDRDGLFAAITAALDRMRFSVAEARVLSSDSGRALDTFLLLDGDTQAPADAARVTELRQGLVAALSGSSADNRVVRRGLSRRQRHFQMAPRIAFTDDIAGGRTQLALVCSDRPGILAVVAQAFREAGARVHDARIATFGERVEDFFQITDEAGRPLSEARQHDLREILIQRIDPEHGDTAAHAES